MLSLRCKTCGKPLLFTSDDKWKLACSACGQEHSASYDEEGRDALNKVKQVLASLKGYSPGRG